MADNADEIVAIPKLLDMLVIDCAVVTIDAMGRQRAIAQKIVDEKAHYILAPKGQQGASRQDVDLFVAEQNTKDFKDTTVTRGETVDGDHGRAETRASRSVSLKYPVSHFRGPLQIRSPRTDSDSLEPRNPRFPAARRNG